MPFCDLPDALATLTVLLDSSVVQYQRSSADALAFEPCAPHAGAHSFDDQRAFELSDGADDDHDGPAQRAAGVDIFAEADELDSDPVEFVEHIEEVLTDRAIRSQAQTRTTSNRPRRASAII